MGGGLGGKNLKEGDELKDIGFRGDDIKIDREETEWIHLARVGDQCTTLVNTPVNRVPKMWRFSVLAQHRLGSKGAIWLKAVLWLPTI
jgi:hypothetical protein